MNRSAIRTLAALAGLAGAAGLANAENYGRVTEPNEVVASTIFPVGDADDMVFDAGAGWKVQATMKFKGAVPLPPLADGSPAPILPPLAPLLELVAPNGTVQTLGVVAKASKKAATLKATLTQGGRFALRMRGSSGTGLVELKWKLTPGKVLPLKNVIFGANTTTDFPFAARGGALVSWTLKLKGDGACQVETIIDPDGEEVAYDPEDENYITRSLTSEKVSNFPLPVGRPGGQYKLRLENKAFPVTVNLAVKVVYPKGIVTPVTLTRQEPVLTDIGRSQAGCGIRIAINGTNLDDAPQSVLFGTTQALEVDVIQGSTEQDADTCSATVPGGTGLVDVIYVAADGQRAILPQAFTFSPLPVVTSFTPDVGPGAGNITLTVKGSGFEYPSQGLYQIRVGGVPCSQVQVVDENTIIGKTPAHVSGPKQVVIRNNCNEDSIAPGVFTYAVTLNISNVIPDAVPVFGGIPVVIYGTNFQNTNTVYLDGNLVPSTPVLFGSAVIAHRIDGANVPAHAAGKVDVEVRQGVTSSVRDDGLAYYGFTDITADAGSGIPAIPAWSLTDDWGGVSTAVADTNADGKTDFIFISDSAALSATRSGTRILKNTGNGTFNDVTGTMMPVVTAAEGFGAVKILVTDFLFQAGVPKYPDIYLARPGTGTSARLTGDKKFTNGWGKLLFGSEGQGYTAQSSAGNSSKLNIQGILSYKSCYQFDFDFRSVAAGLGDLDNDQDQDIVLVNSSSIASYTGGSNYARWMSCAGGYYSCWYSTNTNPIGSAMRLCTVTSTGSVLDRTSDLLKTTFSNADDFRGVAVAVGDMNHDNQGLNDIVLVSDDYPGGTLTSCTRIFQQKTDNLVNSFVKFSSQFLPAVQTASDDDWRGHTVAVPDLNQDLFRDLIIGYDGALPTGRPISTRVLINDTTQSRLVDQTAAVFGGLFPAGDDGRSRFVLAQDVDGDGDRDILLSTSGTTGAGNPRTRYLLNVGKNEVNGLPIFINATSIIPVQGADTGAGVSIATGDIDGDGDQDIIITDVHGGAGVVKTRIWRQDR